MIETSFLHWAEELQLDKPIISNGNQDFPSVTCSNCNTQIGHPSILYQTNYECPKCGFKYKNQKYVNPSCQNMDGTCDKNCDDCEWN